MSRGFIDSRECRFSICEQKNLSKPSNLSRHAELNTLSLISARQNGLQGISERLELVRETSDAEGLRRK